MSKLEVHELVKRANRNLILDHVSFDVKDDEFFVLLGPSEGGKTTILRLLCGFEKPDSGHIELNGKNITILDPQSRNIAVVFQDNSLFPYMSVFENIAYGLRFRRFSKEEIEIRVAAAADMLGLQDLLKRPLGNLSGGETQRVAIGRVMVKEADLYLFDEPISQLDPTTRRRTRQDILMVHRIRNKPCIYITQDQNEAFSMANRVALIASGKVHQIGTPDELRHHPANLFVAKFLSDPPLNVLEGFIHHVDTRYRLRTDGMYFTFPLLWTPVLARLGPQSKILLGIVPSQIVPEWAFDTIGNIPHMIMPAQVTRVGPLMGRQIVQFTIENGKELTAELKDTNYVDLRIGQVIKIAINPEKIFFFNPHTNERLKPTHMMGTTLA